MSLHGFKPVDFGVRPNQVECRPAYREIEVRWIRPIDLRFGEPIPSFEDVEHKPGYLYVLGSRHHRALQAETIAYVGRTINLSTRFLDHAAVRHMHEKPRRQTFLSVGLVDFGTRKSATARTKQITEELEHIFIWALGPELNLSKQVCVPTYGSNGGDPWHIVNTGHTFSGAMPSEIIFPWMLTKARRRPRAKT